MRKLVTDFVECFFEQEEIKKALRRMRLTGPKTVFTQCVMISAKEGRDRVIPPIGKRGCHLAMLVRTGIKRAIQRRCGRIVDQPDQTPNIPNSRRLAPPLVDGTSRLALEINDKNVVFDDQ